MIWLFFSLNFLSKISKTSCYPLKSSVLGPRITVFIFACDCPKLVVWGLLFPTEVPSSLTLSFPAPRLQMVSPYGMPTGWENASYRECSSPFIFSLVTGIEVSSSTPLFWTAIFMCAIFSIYPYSIDFTAKGTDIHQLLTASPWVVVWLGLSIEAVCPSTITDVSQW